MSEQAPNLRGRRRPKVIQYFTGARCAHCRGPQIGMAALENDGGKVMWLCHPDVGMDCYHLVTVYGHGPACDCRGEPQGLDRCYQCDYLRSQHNDALPQRLDFLGNLVPCVDFMEYPAPDPFSDL